MRFSSLTPLILILAFSCSSEQPHDHASHEGKGLNDAFLADNLKVEEWVERFEKEGREIFSQRAEIAATANLTAGMVMADIGAGTGLFEPLFSQAVGTSGKVIAVDIAKDFLTRIDGFEIANVETVLCDEHTTGLEANSIDVAFVCDTYHHFSNPADTLASIHQALKPGGHLIIVEFHRIEGESSDWIMKHVRAGEKVFTDEITAAGFEVVKRHEILEQNYILDFKRVN